MAEDARLPRMAQAALLLAGGHAIGVVADRVGVAESTLWRWRRLPKFARRVREIRKAGTERAVGILGQSSALAAATLSELLQSDDARIKLAAAKSILDAGRGLTETIDLADQLDAVERAVARQAKGPAGK